MSHYTGAKPDEVFVGNMRTKKGVPEYLRRLTTLRIGDQALDIEGKRLPSEYMRPLFVCRSELAEYERIMMQQMKRGL